MESNPQSEPNYPMESIHLMESIPVIKIPFQNGKLNHNSQFLNLRNHNTSSLHYVESELDPFTAERPPSNREQREEVHAVPHPARGQDHARPQDVLQQRRGRRRGRGADRHHAVQRGTSKHEVVVVAERAGATGRAKLTPGQKCREASEY